MQCVQSRQVVKRQRSARCTGVGAMRCGPVRCGAVRCGAVRSSLRSDSLPSRAARRLRSSPVVPYGVADGRVRAREPPLVLVVLAQTDRCTASRPAPSMIADREDHHAAPAGTSIPVGFRVADNDRSICRDGVAAGEEFICLRVGHGISRRFALGRASAAERSRSCRFNCSKDGSGQEPGPYERATLTVAWSGSRRCPTAPRRAGRPRT